MPARQVQTTTTVVETPRGTAEVIVERPPGRASALLALGHGAGGSVDAPDLAAVASAAVAAGLVVARVTQPYRVAGRRTPPPAPALDEAWLAAVRAVITGPRRALPLVVGGRSSGARVACRTAAALGAVGVIALAFPLHPPGRPDRSRADELDPQRPTLVVNGDRDPFGVPAPVGRVQVHVMAGDRHDLRRDPPGLARVVLDWLRDLPDLASLNPTNPA